jgi:hypothetical protein
VDPRFMHSSLVSIFMLCEIYRYTGRTMSAVENLASVSAEVTVSLGSA